MIQLSGVALRRGTQELLRDADLQIHEGERVGVVGPNGCGKSSLFALLGGELHVDAGDCLVPGDWRIAQMAQEVAASEQSALDYVLDGHAEYRRIQQQIADCGDDHRLAELHERFDGLDGYEQQSRAHELLAGLGFAADTHANTVGSFSGGWRTRLALARTLMMPSRLLLLDEPTNHLDLDAILWLESWLRRYQGTLLLISHDRDFLDAVVSHVVAFENRTLDGCRGNYSDWEQRRSERLAQQQREHRKQQARVREIEAFVARFRYKASKARQAQSRLKELERMQRIAPAHVDSPFRFRLPCDERVSTPLLTLQGTVVGYDAATPVARIDCSLMPGQRIGLLGPNGAGKSTLIRTLAGEMPILEGQLDAGDNLHCGYFAQHQLDALDAEASPLLHLQRLAPAAREQELRDFIGGYGFGGEQADTEIASFSGGERARLALALLAWQKPNLLLLDEPTNHLDLEMRHALTVALQEYPGAMLLVSHDRHLLRSTVDEFWLVLDGRIGSFDGDLDDYQREISRRRDVPPAAAGPQTTSTRREQRRAAARRRQDLQPLKRQLGELETLMTALSGQLSALDDRLADPSLYDGSAAECLPPLLQEQARLRRALARAEEDWLEASTALDSARGPD